jgi:coenzyme F420-0:L-glutamate ligase/coenzyme F420-1:gamma-L-glutamate ligase
MKKIEVLGLQTIPEIKQGDDLAEIIVKSSNNEVSGLQDKDIIVLTTKIVSKAAGRMRKLSEVQPGKKAISISRHTGKDAKWLQMIFDEGNEILAILPIKGIVESSIINASTDTECSRGLCEHEQALCITRDTTGRIHTCDAGIDGSNHQPDIVSLLPQDPDAEAKKIRLKIQKLTGKQVAVILADTEMLPFGTIDLALGSSGIQPRAKEFGKPDLFGKPKFGGIDITAYELTAASALLFGQTGAAIPVAIIRGLQYQVSETENIANTLVPPKDNTQLTDAIKATMRATAHACNLKMRLLLKITSWFI